MINRFFLTPNKAWLVVGMSLFAAFTGCVVEPAGGYRGHLQVETDFQDDYDYYPEYETYYSRNRHEFVYLDGGIWVRRPEPRGVSGSVILAATSVRLDFHDAPERHHSTVIRSYPRTSRGPETNHAVKQERENVQPERHEVRPEQPAVSQERRRDAKAEEHHEATPETPVVKQAPAESKPEHRASKPKPPVKKKIEPKEEHPDNKPEEKKDDHKEERKDDKRDDNKTPNR